MIQLGVYLGGWISGNTEDAAATIKECGNEGKVTTTLGHVGGIVGFMRAAHTIERCYNKGEITGLGLATSDTYTSAGGITGVRRFYKLLL